MHRVVTWGSSGPCRTAAPSTSSMQAGGASSSQAYGVAPSVHISYADRFGGRRARSGSEAVGRLAGRTPEGNALVGRARVAKSPPLPPPPGVPDLDDSRAATLKPPVLAVLGEPYGGKPLKF